ncbi:NACHT domain-containing protein [Psychrobacter sp. SCQQ22]|uniref:NACHT domain-containing protein n=1 Tax=Psychrobacter TaxID=497 RepID=UPI0018CC8F35|nr:MULTISPECIES: NACHT domain-containing protein [Psychrobacter]MBH0084695.1 NACHT domain-containing protein [Psychrobacter sp. SCQQ22]
MSDPVTPLVLKATIPALIKKILDEIRPAVENMNDQTRQFFEIGLKKYLNKKFDQYSELKTLLRGNTPVYIYNIYYPVKLKNDHEVIETNIVANIFKKSNAVTIIGDAGSGKSTLIKHLFLNSIKTGYAIPVLVELRYLNNNENSLQEYIKTKVLEDCIAENPNILERIFEKGKFIFFLDGYDELNVEVKSDIVQSLSEFSNKYPENKFILTTRPYSGIEQLQRFHNYYVKELSMEDGEISGFVDAQLRDEVELRNKINESIINNSSMHINGFLTNPLLLSLYILTFKSNADIPAKKHIFYRRVIQALFSEHDSQTKVGYIRQKQSGLVQEEFEIVLQLFCYLSYFDSKFNWDSDYIFEKFKIIRNKSEIKFENQKVLKDLSSAVALWIEDNGLYSFAHRSLQEYFVSLFVKQMTLESKEIVYNKILNRLDKNQIFFESENFLSLLEEMDELNFNKLYYLPLLIKIENLLDFSNDKSLYLSFIKSSFPKVTETSDFMGIGAGIEFSDDFGKLSSFKEDYLIKLHSIIIKAIKSIDKKEWHVASEIDGVKYWEVSLIEEIPNHFIHMIYDDALNIAISYKDVLLDEIRKTKYFIEKSEKNDIDFADLI